MSTAAQTTAQVPTILIRPSHGWVSLKLGEVWEYRELLYFLIWREVKLRYKQTVFGAGWAILQPLMTMLVFTIFFGRLAGVGSDGVPYPIFSYAGLLPWIFFADGVNKASGSLLSLSGLLTKVYFPRLIVPLSAVLSGLLDFAIAFLVLIGMMVYYGVWPSWAVLYLPFLLLLALGSALGVGIWLSPLNVWYRDIRYVVPFFVQLWLFVTPVIYPASRASAKLAEIGLPAWLLGLNPMAGVVEGFRWALLGTGSRPGPIILASVAVTLLLLVSGTLYFRRMEKTLADVV
jgi:lipopolysaccharide transport system permease protein